VKTSALRKQITTKPASALSEAALEADRQKMIEYYQGKGFSDVDVHYRTQGDEKKGTVRVIFDVIEGGKSKIDHVRFEGNTAVKRSELQKAIKTRPKSILPGPGNVWGIFSTTAGKLNNESASGRCPSNSRPLSEQGIPPGGREAADSHQARRDGRCDVPHCGRAAIPCGESELLGCAGFPDG